jgi:predicted RNA polymerase sigma factor
MEIQASRTRARITSTGEPVLLFDQNRTQWDQLLICRGLTAIERAHKINTTRAPYLLQAEIAACHAAPARHPKPPGTASSSSTPSSPKSLHPPSSNSTVP